VSEEGTRKRATFSYEGIILLSLLLVFFASQLRSYLAPFVVFSFWGTVIFFDKSSDRRRKLGQLAVACVVIFFVLWLLPKVMHRENHSGIQITVQETR
jgi:uncharacterized membrane protein YoaT (DUF817 family)